MRHRHRFGVGTETVNPRLQTGVQAMASPKKKIVYVVGCGRSGTTLLGFAAGNANRTLDLGEVLDFARFSGHPNGFGPETENYAFWASVLQHVGRQLGETDFARLAELQSSVDSHKSFIPLAVLGKLYRKTAVAEYRRFLGALYDGIQASGPFDIFIDSSKYPSRLVHLRNIYADDRIHVIHLIRNPIELARAMAGGEQSVPKSFLQTMLYFFVVNAFSLVATRGLGRDRCVRLRYEDFVSQPEATLRQLGETFSIDTSAPIERIRRQEPLQRGYIFNGNRMRMQERVVFRKSDGVTANRSWFERAIERVARVAFGAVTPSRPAEDGEA